MPNENTDAGFTLVEVMTVVGIIAVLIAVMIPTLLQARTPAQDRQAQTLLRNSLTAAKSLETSDGAAPTRAGLASEEVGVQFVTPTSSASASQRVVSVDSGTVGSTWYLILASQATSGRCFALLERPDQGPRFQRIDNAATCRAGQFDTVSGWTGSWS